MAEAFDLLRHGRFVRAIARELAHDEEAADELAARTLATAWERQPSEGPGLRLWLRRVAIRLFLRERRDVERRTRRELAAAAASSDAGHEAPATVDLVARVELERRIAAAFAQLEEPYHTTLFLRYFDDLAPAQISERTGVPVETVSTRLKRGRERLRAALDAQLGNRDRWRATAMALAMQGTPGAAAAVKGKLAAAAVAALLVIGGSLAAWRAIGRAPLDPTGLADPAAAAGAAPSARDEDARLAAEVVRSRVVRDPSGIAFASGVVVDEAGAPVAGVRVIGSRLDRVKGSDRHFQHSFEVEHVERDTLATSDAQGRFVVAEPIEDLVSLRFFAQRFALCEWRDLKADRAANQSLRVVLHPGRRLRGSVSDSDGDPVKRVVIDCWWPLPAGDALPIAANLADRPKYLPSGHLSVPCDESGHVDANWIPDDSFSAGVNAIGYYGFEVTSKALPDPWDVTLRRTHLIVEVTDADTGALIESATAIVVERASGRMLRTLVPTELDFVPVRSAEYRTSGMLYTRVGFGKGLEYAIPDWLKNAPGRSIDLRVHALATGYVGASADFTLTTTSEPPHLRFELVPDDGSPRESSIAGRVIGGSCVEIALHALSVEEYDGTLQNRMPLLSTTPALDGSYAFADLPAGHYRLFVRGGGAAPHVVDVESPSGGNVIQLGAAAAFEFTVKDSTGRPVKAAVVHLQSPDAKRAWSTRADEHGIAVVDGLPEGPFFVLACEPPDDDRELSRDAARLNPDCFDAKCRIVARAGERTRMELPLLEPVPFQLHFERDDGAPVAKVVFRPRDESGAATAGSRHLQLMNELSVNPDSRGDATVTLYPGRYVFRVSDASLTRDLARDVAIEVPRTTDGRAIVRLPVPGAAGTLRGRLVDEVTRQPVARRDVLGVIRVDGAAPIQLEMRTTDSDGRFEFVDAPVGVAELTIRADCVGTTSDGWITNDDAKSPYALATQRATIADSRVTELEIALPPVRSTVANFPKLPIDVATTDAASGKPLRDVEVRVFALRDDGERLVGTLHTDAAGHARAELFAAELYRLRASRRYDPSTQTPAYLAVDVDAAAKEGAVAVSVALAPGE